MENARQNLIFQIVCFAIFFCIFVIAEVDYHIRAIVERIVADACNAAWDGNRSQACATVERIAADSRYTTIRRNYAVFATCNQRPGSSFNQAVVF